jgi:hypothetical protein
VKACEQLRAKSIWYEWKRGWVTQMHDRSLDAIEELENVPVAFLHKTFIHLFYRTPGCYMARKRD